MKSFPDYYPARPRKVPADLTEPSPAYRRQINLFGFSLLLFFLLYFGLILLFVVGIVYCATTPGVGQNDSWNILRWILAGALTIPVIILIKNLFHKEKRRRGYEVEIFPEDHPKLFRFVECVCEETGAPKPDRILINFEVNAAASSGAVSLASLFKSPERSLYLGLGLINVLNMTEFKALLAHEFGHFSQQSMKSGPFVRLAMQVIINILHGTKFGLDKVMEAIFIFVVKLQLALSREMEFHADLVSVSVTGSDAVAHLLFKCYWADTCLQQTIADMDTAREHQLYSRDIFGHQRRAGTYLRERKKDPNLGKPPVLLEERDHTYQLFQPEADDLAEMWSDHPTNFERELNAKACYIRTDFDETSPWTLFGDLESLRRKVSAQFYRQVFRVKQDSVTWSSPSKVQEFLDDERAESTFDEERYGTLYNHRNLQCLDLRALRGVSEKTANSPQDLLASLRSLYTPKVRKFGETYQRHVEEYQMLRAIKKRWHRPEGKRFKMRRQTFHVREAGEILTDLEKELEADDAWLRAFDTKVFVAHFELAWQMDEDLAEELFKRYQFHFVIQDMWSILQEHFSPMRFMFDLLSAVSEQGGRLDEDTYHLIVEVFCLAHGAVNMVLEEADLVRFPELAHMPAGKPVRPFLLKGPLVSKPSHFDYGINIKSLANFADQFQSVERRLNRLHFKSLGNILAMQETILVRAEKKWEKANGEQGQA